MDHKFQFLCQVETRRLLFLLSATFAIVLVVQYFEFPYGQVLSSLFSVGNASSFPPGQSSLKSEMAGKMTLSTGINASNTYAVNDIAGSTKASKETDQGNELKGNNRGPKNDSETESNGRSIYPFGVVSNGTSLDNLAELNKSYTLENEKNSGNGPAPQKAIAPEQNFFEEKVIKDDSNSSFSNIQVEDITSTPEKSGSSDSCLASPSFALPPINSKPSKTYPADTPFRSNRTSVNSNVSSVGKDAAGTLNNDDNPEYMQGNYSLSDDDSSTTRVPARKKKRKSKKPPSKVITISEMNKLLLQSHASSRSVTPQWSSKIDQELLFARLQIENAPIIKNDDRGLYAPLYRNVSMFKRSYELMENMLKVYIYQEGEKPIFHQQILEGIYASEGWFMKLMEANTKFVTQDPGKAHLFYLPFSSRLLELTLYVRNSHSRNNLIQYMKNYVEMITRKYPFWNRTSGTDHFLAACHDWAPAETRGHMLNCIRALCNADIDAGFSIGKDVSLPETYVRSAQNTLNRLGGYPPSQRTILAFFAGGMHGYVRPILLNYWGNKDPNMKIFGQMPHVKGNTNYIQHMKSSKYCICAKGFEVNSPRVVEAILYECVPVIISDNYVPPLFELLNWESFAVFILEKDIPNLKNILLSISEEKYIEMHEGVKKVQQHFLWHAKPVKYDLFHMILHSVWYNRVFR